MDISRYAVGAALLMFWCLDASAAVYRWIDKDGKVHFSDRPVAESAREVQVKTAPLYKDDSGTAQQRKMEQEKLLRMFDEKRQEKAEQNAKAKEEAKKRDRRCATARDRLRRYRLSTAIYEPQSDGSRKFLSNEAREAEIAAAEQNVAHWCK